MVLLGQSLRTFVVIVDHNNSTAQRWIWRNGTKRRALVGHRYRRLIDSEDAGSIASGGSQSLLVGRIIACY